MIPIKKTRYDMSAPGTRALIDQIVHGTFMREGTMAAFPLCFPGATVPIPADESHITALTVHPNGIVYGGTSGRRAHLFCGLFHGVTGAVLDLGVPDAATDCVAVACGKEHVLACVNGPQGGRIVATPLRGLPFDLIQEWGFPRPTLQEVGAVAGGEPILQALAEPAAGLILGATAHHLFTVHPETLKIELRAEAPNAARIILGTRGGLFGLDGPEHLWRYDLSTNKLQRRAVLLPAGQWGCATACITDRAVARVYLADETGVLFAFDETRGFTPALGRTPLAPVTTMASTHDGRLFGFCGHEMAHLFCYDPHALAGPAALADLGVAVSVLERRRYGYAFATAVTGRDGQIIFGEDDDLGHLWLYFPSIAKRPLLPVSI